MSTHRHTHHNETSHRHNRYFRENKHVFWVLVTLFSVLPLLLIMLKLYRRVSEYQAARNQSRDYTGPDLHTHDGIYSITIKQDCGNFAPPRYSDLAKYPISGTYEEPPPYSQSMIAS